MDRRASEALDDVQARERTVGGDARRARLGKRLIELGSILEREGVELLLHAPGAVESAAFLDQLHLGSGQELKQVEGAQANVLGAQMTGRVISDAPLRLGEGAVEATLLVEL